MKLAIIGSRNLYIDVEKYIPARVSEIVTGGARGIDACAAEYARKRGIKLTEFLPEYSQYGDGAPIKRNERIVEYADEAIAFWDGKSVGTKYMIGLFRSLGKRVIVIVVDEIEE